MAKPDVLTNKSALLHRADRRTMSIVGGVTLGVNSVRLARRPDRHSGGLHAIRSQQDPMTMTDFLFNEHDLFASNHAVDAKYPCIQSDDSATAPGWSTHPLHIIPDDTPASWMSHENNALGLSGMDRPDSTWTSGFSPCLSATSRPNQIDSQSFSFLHPPSRSDSALRFCQSPIPYWDHPSTREDAALFGAGECLSPHSFRSVTARESHHAPMSKRVSTPRSTPPYSQRYTPYSFGVDGTQKNTSPVSDYRCQWTDGTRPCGTVITGTKLAIGKHLRTAHAIRLKADKTSQICWWDGCCREMRSESIARHILAVHMQDKVSCSSCETRFARRDSLQRHRRMQCRATREAANAGEVGK